MDLFFAAVDQCVPKQKQQKSKRSLDYSGSQSLSQKEVAVQESQKVNLVSLLVDGVTLTDDLSISAKSMNQF